MNTYFTNENVKIADKYKKRFPASLFIREVQIKTTIRYPFTLTRMDIIKKTDKNKSWKGCVEIGTLL